MPLPTIEPALVNSANPWASNRSDLQALFDCTSTGAVTTRTSLLKGFNHDDDIHQHTFFDPQSHGLVAEDISDGDVPSEASGSLNTFGYSPLTLGNYLDLIETVVKDSKLPQPARSNKAFIISVTGSAEDVRQCYRIISDHQKQMKNPLCMEINLSCPNIPDKPPPAYSGQALAVYLNILRDEMSQDTTSLGRRVPTGVKTPPYTYADQFKILVAALLESCQPSCPIDFITATNTLGSSLLLDSENNPALPSATHTGIGGLAGSSLHPLALGNVKTIRSMLDEHGALESIDIIGTGGVSDAAGYRRMMSVGARVIGVGTALGREGVNVFEKILHSG